MIIPPDSLSADTLTSLIEEFISRDGTDYGEVELSLEQKVALLRPQVVRGDVLIIFDDQHQTVNLVHRKDWREEDK